MTTYEWIEDGNRAYQDQLAQSLMSSMDYEDAIDLCVNNEWLGVLNQILSTRTN